MCAALYNICDRLNQNVALRECEFGKLFWFTEKSKYPQLELHARKDMVQGF